MNLALLDPRSIAFDWYQLKLFVQHASGFSMDAMHVVAGVILHLAIAALLKSSLARPLPLLLVLAVEIVNEATDFRVEIWPDPGMQIGEAVKDVVLTVIIPTVIFLVARYRPKLLVQRSS